MNTAQAVPTRRFAGVFDLRVDGPAEQHGVGFGSEYIGGCSGIGWYEYFRDAVTSEIYRVHCSDGINGGKSAHSDQDEAWLGKCYWAIVKRCHFEASLGQSEIRISRNERVIMHGMAHSVWLESEPKKGDGEYSQTGLEGGLVGRCHGVSVICDLECEDKLPPRMEEAVIGMGDVFAKISHPEAREGEVWVGNRPRPRRLAEMRAQAHWRTERLGESAYDGDNKPIAGSQPVFIQKSELDYELAALKRAKSREATQN